MAVARRERRSTAGRRTRRALAAMAACALVVACAPAGASAATLVVENTNDSGPGSLRQAIVSAGPGETILVPAGTIALSTPLDVNKNLTIDGAGVSASVISGGGASRVVELTGSPAVTLSGMTITEGLAASGGGIAATGTLTLAHVAVVGNHAEEAGGEGSGGGIDFKGAGALDVIESSVSDNVAGGGGGAEESGFGGGVAYEASADTQTFTLTLTRSSVDANRAGGDGPRAEGVGGGIDVSSGHEHGTITLDLDESAVAGNAAGGGGEQANGFGGGLGLRTGTGNNQLIVSAKDSALTRNTAGGGASEADGEGGGMDFYGTGSGVVQSLELRNTTVSSNSAGGGGAEAQGEGGGIVFGPGTATLEHVTVAGNTAGSEFGVGGGLELLNVTAGQIEDSIVAENSAETGANCSEHVRSGGHNLDDGSSCGFEATGDKEDTPAKLGPLGDHGGSTETQMPLAGSPAIDGAERATCPASDQRGAPHREGQGCDIGAVQLQAPSVEAGSLVSAGVTVATLAVGVNPNFSATNFSFQFGTGPGYGSSSSVGTLGEAGTFESAVTVLANLKPSTVYHFRVVAFNAVGTVLGPDQTFITGPAPPAPPAAPASPKARTRVSAPALSAARLSNTRFRVGNRSTAVAARKAPVGTRFVFRLSAAASVQIVFTRSVAGLRKGHRCVLPTKKLRRAHAKRCTRMVGAGKLTRAHMRAGANAISFTGRLGANAFAPSHYRAVLSASNVAGVSRPLTLAFSVVR